MRILYFLISLTLISSIYATVYIPIDEMENDNRIITSPLPDDYNLSPLWGEDYLDYLKREVAFLDALQVKETGPDYGGIREGESDLWNIIQTDNTEESIWVWTRYYELTRDNKYLPNIKAAWEYCLNHPAWQEEGGGGQYGYYRVYVGGWGMRAEMKYRQIYKDDTYKAYGENCAEYIRDNSLAVENANAVFLLCQTWADGNLYDYGVYVGDETYKDAAVTRSEQIKSLVESNTDLLGRGMWAMSGGVIPWGLDHTYFRKNSGKKEWMKKYEPYMKDYVDYTYSTWHSAWNMWYALGHWTTYIATWDNNMFKTYQWLTDHLIADDTDKDGGVPASEADPDTRDQTWVSNYLVYMGIDPFFQNVGIELIYLSARRTDSGVLISWDVTSDEKLSFNLYKVSNDSGQVTKINDVPITGIRPFRYIDRINSIEFYLSSDNIKYVLKIINDENESTLGECYIDSSQTPFVYLGANYPNPFSSETIMPYIIIGESNATLEVYDISGRLIGRMGVAGKEGSIVVSETSLGGHLNTGIYQCILRVGDSSSSRRIVYIENN
ncbi:MAG: T9SS type A sorting domain-containing protein [bacterium]